MKVLFLFLASLYLCCSTIYAASDILSEYFHYNMGTGSNAWFYQDTPVYNGDNYTSNRKIHIVTPN